MWENFRKTLKMAEENSLGKMALFMKEIFWMGKLKARERWSEQMVRNTQGNLRII